MISTSLVHAYFIGQFYYLNFSASSFQNQNSCLSLPTAHASPSVDNIAQYKAIHHQIGIAAKRMLLFMKQVF